MKRKIMSILLAFVLVVSALPLSGIDLIADASWPYDHLDGETDEWFYSTNHDHYDDYGGLAVYWYKGNEKNVVIPSEINGIPVTCVDILWTNKEYHDVYGDPWYDTSNVESIVVPDTVKVLSGSFYNLENLKSVTLPEGLERIESCTFYGCSKLTEIDIPDSVYSIYYEFVFENCSINEVEFGSSIELIDFADLSGAGIKKMIFNAPEIQLSNVHLATVDEIVCNGMVNRINPTIVEESGTVRNKNIEIVCNGGVYSTCHNRFTREKGLYAHYDDANGTVTYNTVPADKGTEYVSGDYKYYLNGNNEAVISRYLGTGSEVTVPATIDGYTVTEIGESAFYAETKKQLFDNLITENQITSLVLPDSIKKIGSMAFSFNKSLVSVDIPDAVTVVSTRAFEACFSLANIGWPANLKTIGSMAFYRCLGLTSLQIPEGVTRIGSNAFSGCDNLQSVSLPQTLTSIGNLAFKGDLLLESVSIPDSVTELGLGAFMDCEALQTAKLPSGLEVIPDFLFHYTNLQHIDIPETVTKIGCGAFYGTTLGEVTFPEGLRYIAYGAFDAAGLTELKLPSSVEYVGSEAFSNNEFTSLVLDWQNVTVIEPYTFFGCESLKKVEVRGAIKEIRQSAFAYCDALTDVYFSDNVEKIYIEAFAKDVALKTVTTRNYVEYIGPLAFWDCTGMQSFYLNSVNCTTDAAEDMTPFMGSGVSQVVIGSDAEIINGNLFRNMDSLTKVEIGDGVKTIGEYAFAECENLKSVTIPGSVKTIGDYAFYDCVAITYVSKLKNVVSVGEGAFAGCEYLEVIEFSDNLKTLSESVFSGCKRLKTVILPDSLERIEKGAFYNCVSLKTITIPANVKELGEAFRLCKLETVYYNAENCVLINPIKTEIEGVYKSPFAASGVKKIVVGDNVKKVPDFLFTYVSTLETVTLPEHIESLGKAAFAFSGIKTVTGLKVTQEIEEYTFYKCTNLTEIDLSDISVTDIGNYAFANSGIVSFKASENLESIGRGCFEGCKNLESVDLGGGATVVTASVTDNENPEAVNPVSKLMLIGTDAFANCTSLTEIVIPDSVKDVGEKAFYGDTALLSVKMSDNVIFIPDECFKGCTALTTFIWNPESKLIGRLAFGDCTSLSEFDFVNIEKLYDNSFLNSGVADVQLGEARGDAAAKLTEVEIQSFMNCDSLSSVGVGGNVTTIKTQAFANCENLESVYIADSVTEIAPDAFDGCENIMIYCSVDSYAYAYAQTQGIKVSTLVIAPIPNQTYTGEKIEPRVTVTASGNNLVENVDFGLTFANNINVGNADVNVKGKGDFRMFSSKANFTIVTKHIASSTIAPIDDQPYTGEAITPKLVVTDGYKYLSEGKDYTVTYYSNVNSGVATAKITGIGNYSGYETIQFNILEEVKEPTLLEKIITAVMNFFARIRAFLVGIFA